MMKEVMKVVLPPHSASEHTSTTDSFFSPAQEMRRWFSSLVCVYLDVTKRDS
ncbi:hypothetical protein BC826DRAFT_1012731, partial [Russula brevipes]